MKTFAEYRESKKKEAEETKKRRKRPSEETDFGQHSIERQSTKKKRKLSEETSFGEHSEHRISEAKIEHQNEVERDKDEHDYIHKIVAPIKTLKHHEKEEVIDYTDHSTPINHTLIHYHNGHSINQKIKPQIETLTKTIGRHSTTEDNHVYTGVKRSPARHFEEGQQKVEVHHPAFISSSTSFELAKGFSESKSHEHNERHGVHLDQNGQARHVLKIHMPKGTQAMSVKKHTFNPGEHEVLLNRGHDLEIHHKPTLHIDKNGDKYHVWHAKIVGHSPANLDGEDL